MTKFAIYKIYIGIGENMRKFKSKRKFSISFIWYILFVFIAYQLISYVFINIKLADNNESFIKYMLEDSNYYLLYKKNTSNLFNKFLKTLIKIDSPIKLEQAFKVDNPTFIDGQIPNIYIYSTHPKEGYLDGYLEGYSINPNILMASSLLQQQLMKEGITSLVEQSDLTSYMNKNSMDFYQSYKASRVFLEQVIKKYPNMDLIIDLHRDAVERKNTYVEINGKSYAKVLFVVGQKYDTYKLNLELVNKINDKIKEKYPTLTRGVMMKNRPEQNGVYNQDLNPNIILLELGSNNNTIDEVYNTIELIAPILKEVINEIKT